MTARLGRRATWAAVLGFAGLALALAAKNLRPVWDAPTMPAAPHGPAPRAAPAGATVAHDEKELERLLASGPNDIWLEDRIYHGDFVIKRPLGLHGSGQSVLDGSGTGTVVTVEADDVTLENFTVRDSGRRHTHEDGAVRVTGARIQLRDLRTEDTLFGIELFKCTHCLVEGVHVAGTAGDELRGDGIKVWESHDSLLRHSLVENARDTVIWYSRRVTLEDVVVRHSRYGAHFMYAHDSVARRGRFMENDVGIFVMYSNRVHAEGNVLAGARGAAGMGIGFKESESVSVEGNWIVANTTGIYLDQTPRSPGQDARFEHNVMALNDVALRTHGANRDIYFSDNELNGNGEVGEVDGGGDMLGLTLVGNYWSDYAGYDLDRDGFGDVPYEVKRLSGELTDARPALKLFKGTVAMSLVDAIAEAVPTFARKKLLSDPRPAFVRRHR